MVESRPSMISIEQLSLLNAGRSRNALKRLSVVHLWAELSFILVPPVLIAGVSA